MVMMKMILYSWSVVLFVGICLAVRRLSLRRLSTWQSHGTHTFFPSNTALFSTRPQKSNSWNGNNKAKAWSSSSSSSANSYADSRTSYGSNNSPTQVRPNQCLPGTIVEYITAKGTKQLAIVKKKRNQYQIEALNIQTKEFLLPMHRILKVIPGNYSIEDVTFAQKTFEAMSKSSKIEIMWETCLCRVDGSALPARPGLINKGHLLNHSTQSREIATDPCSYDSNPNNDNPHGILPPSTTPGAVDITFITRTLFSTVTALNQYIAERLMSTMGQIYFERVIFPSTDSNDSNGSQQTSANTLYTPHPAHVVAERLRDSAALREFKERFVKIMTNTATTSMPEMPGRVSKVLDSYSEGLKQVVLMKHPWFNLGWTKRPVNKAEYEKGIELMEYLELAVSYKNARKVLEVIGVWPEHENIEKYLLDIRDEFPQNVLEEAEYLLANSGQLLDPDERLRLDLTYLATYAIDREGAGEVDDAISIEYLEDGQEKLWIHIADVSRWVRPGSALSIEAERRMTTIYMPDEKICMFPERLSSELLSIGAQPISYAFSCGKFMALTLPLDGNDKCGRIVMILQGWSSTKTASFCPMK